MAKFKNNTVLKLMIGIAISGLFLYLAFGKIDFGKMKESFQNANMWLFIPAIFVQFIAHWVRSIRWQYFLNSIKRVPVSTLFTATMIGYVGNTVLPAHLGEVFRANVVGNKEKISTSSTLATLVIERLIDVLSLLVIMVVALIIYPFPDWVTKSGYIMFVLTIGLFVFLVLLKQKNDNTVRLLNFGLKLLPKSIAQKVDGIITSFIDGINGMERKRDYLIVFVLSLSIWFFYWLTLLFVFLSFNLFEIYNINIVSSVVLLVITTISVVVPSSPGYVGTYHYLCQLSLELFGVPRSVGLSFAFVAHGLSIIPTAIVGFFFAWRVGISRLKAKAVES
ncbi:flippase-like domain-containing protein [bacterium]|nr:flippase-like domain-containing protein [bacterium]